VQEYCWYYCRTVPLDADIVETLTALKVVSRCGTGFDNVALIKQVLVESGGKRGW
tara:strand:+ start:601 stop:765 length:165 start_codon:yes stop_codon:yes gene_type:complete